MTGNEMNELYKSAIKAIGGCSFLSSIEEGAKAAQKSIDDFYTAAEGYGYIVFVMLGGGFELQYRDVSEEFDTEYDLLVRMAELIMETK